MRPLLLLSFEKAVTPSLLLLAIVNVITKGQIGIELIALCQL